MGADPHINDPAKQVRVTGRDTRFKPGQSGNPAGRAPKPMCITSLLTDLLTGDPMLVAAAWNRPYTGAMVVALAIYRLMAKGDLPAIKEGWDRVEGRVPYPLQHSGAEGGPITLNIVWESPPEKPPGGLT